MPRSRKNSERIEEVGKDKKEPTRVEALRPQAKGEMIREPIAQIKERFGDILQNLSDLLWEVDENGIFTWCSGAAENIFGVPARELIGKRPFDFMPAEEAQRTKNIIEEMSLKKEPIKNLETYHEDKQGGQHWLCVNGIPILDNKGTLKGYIGVYKDITSQKKAEESLRESELKFRTLADEAFDGIAIHDGQRIIEINKAFGILWGYTPGEAAGLRNAKLFTPECWGNVKKNIQSGYDKPYETVAIRKDGTRFPIEVAGKSIIYKGRTMRIATTRDITERKQVEEALRTSEEQLKTALEAAALGIWDWDLVSGKITWAGHHARLFGFEEEEFDGRYETFDKRVHPDDIAGLRAAVKKAQKERSEYSYEYRVIWPDGTLRWISGKGRCRYDQTGQADRMTGTVQDITERKRAELALRTSEEQHRTILQTTMDGFWLSDMQGRLLEVNDAYCKMSGYSREELLKMSIAQLEAAETPEEVARHIKKTVTQGADRFETLHHCKDGSVFQVEVSTHFLPTEAGRLFCFFRDITERKKAEQAMRESEDKFKTLADESFDSIVIHDGEKIIEVNKAFGRLWGYDPGEAAGLKVDVFFAPECWGDVKKRVQAGYDKPYETVAIRKDGTRFQVEIAGKSITYKGKTVRIATARDITERKRAELALRTSEEQHRTILQTTMDGFWLSDMQGRFLEVNEAYCQMSGYSREELLKMSIAQLEAAETSEEVARHIQKIVAQGTDRFETLHHRKDGSVFSVEVSTHFLPTENGRLFCFFRDITERKRAEERLLKYQKQLKRLASQLALAEERERRRIAGELHDQVGQSLALAKIKLDALRASATSRPADDVLSEVSETLKQVVDETRSLTFDLSYPILYEFGFETAVSDWLNEQVQDKHGIATEFADDGQPKLLDDDVQILLFRNVRELLINCIKHANADKVRVGVRRIDDSIEVTVEDNGVGFDPAEVGALSGKRAEFGLLSIRESLEELGGRFEIESKPGAGCKAVMTAPLKGQPRKNEE